MIGHLAPLRRQVPRVEHDETCPAAPLAALPGLPGEAPTSAELRDGEGEMGKQLES